MLRCPGELTFAGIEERQGEWPVAVPGRVSGVPRSDRRSRYAGEHYRRRLREGRIACGVSRRGNCRDNAPMGTFSASLREDPAHHEDYATREQPRASIFGHIEGSYHRVRRQSSPGYAAPAEYERAHNPIHR